MAFSMPSHLAELYMPEIVQTFDTKKGFDVRTKLGKFRFVMDNFVHEFLFTFWYGVFVMGKDCPAGEDDLLVLRTPEGVAYNEVITDTRGSNCRTLLVLETLEGVSVLLA